MNNPLIDEYLKIQAKLCCQNTWRNLTSIPPKEAKKKMNDYEEAYKKNIDNWNQAPLDRRFND